MKDNKQSKSNSKSPKASKSNKIENPFDKFANTKKKFNVLNRKVKGENRNVTKALTRSIEIRKNKLLLDYKQNKKSNQFIDKRFGEYNTDLTLEDKMMARFQKERMKSNNKNKSLFNLDNPSTNEQYTLTHKGNILSDSNMSIANDDWSDNDDDDDDNKHNNNKSNTNNLNKDLVNQLHFGGGMIKKGQPLSTTTTNDSNNNYNTNNNDTNNDNTNNNNTNKTTTRDQYGNHMTALQEIVAKSKLYKLQRKEVKQEQEDTTNQLDIEFQNLLQNSYISFRDTYNSRGRKISGHESDNEGVEKWENGVEKGETGGEEDDYDKALYEMTYEAKVRMLICMYEYYCVQVVLCVSSMVYFVRFYVTCAIVGCIMY